MSDHAALWITEAEVVSLMDLPSAIDALERGLRDEASGDALEMPKSHVRWNAANLHSLGAAFPARGIAGTKTWTHTTGGAMPLLVLFDASEGRLVAVVEAFALGQLRTASASAVATRWLAADDADELAVVGAGKQALAQVAAIAAVRTLRRVRVFSRDRERRHAFAARVELEISIEAIACESVAAAVAESPIVTTVTRARDPYLSAEMITPRTHVNAVGAILPENAEVTSDLVRRCELVVTDSLASARKLSRELAEAYRGNDSAWCRVRSLAEVVSGAPVPRPLAAPSLFKSLGTGVSDLSLAIEILAAARRRGLGRPIEIPRKVPPRLVRALEERRADPSGR